MSKFFKSAFGFSVSLFPSLALAAADPFQKGTAKVEDLADNLSGPVAIAFFTVVIVVVGYMLATGKMRMGWAIGIIVGAIVIASAASIANWAFS